MRGTVNLNQRPELMDFESSLFLGFVVKLIGHVGQVVADPSTHRNRDMLALAPIVALTPRVGANRK